ncbi:unnamed protein product [Adineta steineri]|uniref:Uncharacterized protein n=1 Tax=Adineta steineri TaxID=433720 RepID=A0A818ZLE3_9BILA|nr:unnamed protein product [Adineta steineri]CAF3773788.1 unnamed protein product [Adineta steineri]
MNTYLYSRVSGSKRFKQHANKCFPLVRATTSSSINFSSSKQTTLNNMGFTEGVKIIEGDVTKIKDLSKFSKRIYSLSAVYETFDINNASRGEKTISRHIMIFVDNLRSQIKEMLSILLKERSLTIYPDYWMDSYKKISYLGITVLFVDFEYGFKSIDFCCKPFEYEKKQLKIL